MASSQASPTDPMDAAPALLQRLPDAIQAIYRRAMERGVRLSLYIENMFTTGHDAANRAAVKQYLPEAMTVGGLALRDDKKVVDKITKGAFVQAAQRLVRDEPAQRLQAERELTQREAAFAQPLELAWQGVLGTVDEAEVLTAAYFQRRFNQAFCASCNERRWLDDHAFAAVSGQRGPPRHGVRDGPLVGQVNLVPRHRQQHAWIMGAHLLQRAHVPGVALAEQHRPYQCEFRRCWPDRMRATLQAGNDVPIGQTTRI